MTPLLQPWSGKITARERFNRQMHFQSFDRSFHWEFGYWDECFTQWPMFRDHGIRSNREAETFLGSPISPLVFLTVIGETLPKEISVEYFDARMADVSGATFILRGIVAGTPEQASGTASSYVDMLRANKRLGAVFNAITLSNLNRDPSSGLLAFEINFKEKSAAKGK